MVDVRKLNKQEGNHLIYMYYERCRKCVNTPRVYTHLNKIVSNTVHAGSNLSDIAENTWSQRHQRKRFDVYIYTFLVKKSVEINMNTYEVGKSK